MTNRNEDTRPPKVNYAELLKQKRKLLDEMKKDVAKQVAVRKNTLDEQMAKALGERRNAISELQKSNAALQKTIKDGYDTKKTIALVTYEAAVKKANDERDDALKHIHDEKESAYSALRDQLDEKSAPIIRKHKHACEDLIEAHAKNEVVQKEATDKLIAALQEDIKDVEEELAARRQRAQDAAALAAATT